MLNKADAQAFLRKHFDMDVEPNDVLVVMYLLGELSQKNLEQSNREVGAKIASDIVLNSHDVLEKAHASIASVGNQVAAMQEAMKVTIHAAEKAERLNAMLDEKIAALDERLARSDEIAKEATKAAHTCNQAVVALTSGLLNIQPKSIWKGK